jgi:hypothetical protein
MADDNNDNKQDATQITTIFGWTWSTHPTDVLYQGDEA